MYSKTGGKNGKHSAITESSSIAAVSYLSVQLFRYHIALQFHSVSDVTAIFQTKRFVLLSSVQFLCLIDTKITDAQLAVCFIELTPEDTDRYRALQNGQKELTAVIKLRKKQGGRAEDLHYTMYKCCCLVSFCPVEAPWAQRGPVRAHLGHFLRLGMARSAEIRMDLCWIHQPGQKPPNGIQTKPPIFRIRLFVLLTGILCNSDYVATATDYAATEKLVALLLSKPGAISIDRRINIVSR